ncbi:hypothetical protein ABEI56_05435 [Peribacillus castrilensis]|uniref:hypothetical protein n=1 Tax=Peribacillus castrilensis TaxID=2897690 RepID=UPI003D2AFE5B
MTIYSILNNLLPILFLVVLWLSIDQHKKQSQQFKELMKKMKSDGSMLSEKALLATYHLKEANYLSNEVKREHRQIRETNKFMNKAVKEKVNKKKIRGKRKRKTA